VFSANLRCDNAAGRPNAREALASGADVVVLQELTEAHLESIRAEGVLGAYPHTLVDARGGAFGSAILSKLPLVASRLDDLAGLPMTRATLEVDGRTLDLINVHTLSPMSSENFGQRDRQLDALADLAAGSGGRPTLMVGDFNANRWHPAFRRLLDTGLHDGHEQVGRGLARTWPNGSVAPTFALLDHVLLSRSVTAVSVREGTGRGSDHRPVVADLRLE
jgi:endonuclease/exonuclease/phosphatase (EEP) superfamily protein YafD